MPLFGAAVIFKTSAIKQRLLLKKKKKKNKKKKHSEVLQSCIDIVDYPTCFRPRKYHQTITITLEPKLY